MPLAQRNQTEGGGIFMTLPDVTQRYEIYFSEPKQLAEINKFSEWAGFWQRWTRLHTQYLQKLAAFSDFISNENLSENLGADFLKARWRMFSAFIQGLKKLNNDFNLIFWKLLFSGHDTFFSVLLNEIAVTGKNQMVHAFKTKNAVSAYARGNR